MSLRVSLFVLGMAAINCSAGAASVSEFGAVGDGQHDDSAAFQAAIDAAFLVGGGEVRVPGSPKGFRLEQPLLIRPNVTLRGVQAGPSDAQFLAAHDAGRGEPEPVQPFGDVPGGLLVAQDQYPAVTLAHNSGIAGLTFVYPDQVPYTPLPVRSYPPTLSVRGYAQGATLPGLARIPEIPTDGPISGRSVSIRDIGILNGYEMLELRGENPPLRQVAQITVDGLWGYPLSVGVNIQNSLDTVLLRNLQLRPTFFHPACGEVSQSGIGLALGKSDGCLISDLLIFGLGIGILHKVEDGALGSFSVRVSNANVEAMIPVWMDSTAVDDQVQYSNSFIFHTNFGFGLEDGMRYGRSGHRLFPDLAYTTADLCCVRVANRCPERDTFQSYIRFVGCGFHARSRGPVCRVEGERLVRVMLASSNMVYLREGVLVAAPGAAVLASITGNDIMCWGSPDLTRLSAAATDRRVVDLRAAQDRSRAVFSSNLLQGLHPALLDACREDPRIEATGNLLTE